MGYGQGDWWNPACATTPKWLGTGLIKLEPIPAPCDQVCSYPLDPYSYRSCQYQTTPYNTPPTPKRLVAPNSWTDGTQCYYSWTYVGALQYAIPMWQLDQTLTEGQIRDRLVYCARTREDIRFAGESEIPAGPDHLTRWSAITGYGFPTLRCALEMPQLDPDGDGVTNATDNCDAGGSTSWIGPAQPSAP
jgi:hypothetical protein